MKKFKYSKASMTKKANALYQFCKPVKVTLFSEYLHNKDVADYDADDDEWYEEGEEVFAAYKWGSDQWVTCLVARQSKTHFVQLYELATCRSWTTDIYQASIVQENMNEWKYGLSPLPSWKYLYQMMGYNSARAFLLGLSFVNALEREMGCPATVVYRATIPVECFDFDKDGTDDANVFIVQADQWFCTNPFATSLYQLLWRMAHTIVKYEWDENFFDVETGEYICDWKRMWQIIEKDIEDGFDYRDTKYVRAVFHRHEVIVPAFKKFFRKTQPMKDYGLIDADGYKVGIHSEAGIGNFCWATTAWNQLNRKLEKFFNIATEIDKKTQRAYKW
jgi:hypothetical protein